MRTYVDITGDAPERVAIAPVAHRQKRAAVVAGVSTRTIARMVANGKLTPVVVEGVELILHDDLLRCLRESPRRERKRADA
jgi:hypothetical protein